jgi:hypothetical protein
MDVVSARPSYSMAYSGVRGFLRKTKATDWRWDDFNEVLQRLTCALLFLVPHHQFSVLWLGECLCSWCTAFAALWVVSGRKWQRWLHGLPCCFFAEICCCDMMTSNAMCGSMRQEMGTHSSVFCMESMSLTEVVVSIPNIVAFAAPPHLVVHLGCCTPC